MEDGIISNDEFLTLAQLGQFESGQFEMEIETELNLEEAKQLLANIL